MAFSYWGGSGPMNGAPRGVQQQFLRDPDQVASLQQREKEFDVSSGAAAGRDAFKENAFNKLFGMSGSTLGPVGGTSAPMPTINRGPLYSQDQIEQQTNQGVAANDSRYQTLMRQLGKSTAARGLGMGSPAVQSQLTQLGIANIGDNARTEMQTPMQYVQGNADQTFRTDQLAQNQWAQGEDVDIKRRQQQMQMLSSLMSSLGSF